MWSINVPALTVNIFEWSLTELTITTRQALQANDLSRDRDVFVMQ